MSAAEKARAVRSEDELAWRGFPYWTTPRHNNLGQPCPMCGGADRFSVNTKKQVFNCRGCGKRGDVIALVQVIDGADFKTAVETLAGPDRPARASIVAKPGDMEDGETTRMADIAAWLWSRHEPVSESNAAGLYLRKHGYTGQFPATLGYLPPNGKHLPALIAASGFCDEPEPGLINPPVHLTRLTPEDAKALSIRAKS